MVANSFAQWAVAPVVLVFLRDLNIIKFISAKLKYLLVVKFLPHRTSVVALTTN